MDSESTGPHVFVKTWKDDVRAALNGWRDAAFAAERVAEELKRENARLRQRIAELEGR